MLRTLIVALALLVASPHLANASCGAYGYRQVCREWFDCRTERYCRYWVRDEPRYERVYGYERRIEELPAPRTHCLFDRAAVRATGDDKLSEEKAQVSAQDRWAVESETRYGTVYSDIRNAARLTKQCVKKVPTSDTEKGQANWLGVRHWVCAIEAIPCLAPKEPIVDEDDLAKRKVEKAIEKREAEVRKADPRADFYEPEAPKKRRWYWRPVRRD